MKKTIHEAVAGNLSRLISHFEMTQDNIAEKTGLGQRTISNVLNPGSVGSITTKTIEALAELFRLEPYHLVIPDLPIEELLNRRIEKVISCYSQTSLEGRQNITRIAENEMRYIVMAKIDLSEDKSPQDKKDLT